jgi:hypothetical protein
MAKYPVTNCDRIALENLLDEKIAAQIKWAKEKNRI